MEQLTIWIETTLGLGPGVQRRLLASALIIVVLYLIRFLIVRFVWRRTEDMRTRYMWRKSSSYAAALLGLLLVGRVWIEGLQSLATFLGLLSAGVAIALKDLVTNVAGWIFILFRKPFELGDRIEINAHAGDVIDIRVFMFSLNEIGNWVDADQSTGRVVHLPNALVLREAIANYGKGFQYIWNEIPVLLTFESDWEKAKAILQRIASARAEHLSEEAQKRVKAAASKFLIFYTQLAPTVYTSVKDSGVLLTIRYLCEPRRRRTTTQEMWEDILREFARCDDIDFAYPTQRFFNNLREGGAGLRQAPAEVGAPDSTDRGTRA